MANYIFDLDGVIADNSRRYERHLSGDGPDWDAYLADIPQDHPIFTTIYIVRALVDHGHTIILITSRADRNDARDDTMAWLARHGVPYHALYMRKGHDFRPDDVIKEELLNEAIKCYGEIAGAFDDRRRICDMYSRRGIYVYDCGQGKGDF